MSNIMESVLKHKGYKETTCDKNKADEFMEKRSVDEDEIYELPKLPYRTKVKSKNMFGCQMILFNESTTAERIILYLHGGAYVNEITSLHIIFCDNLLRKLMQPFLLHYILLRQTTPMKRLIRLLKAYTI